MKHALANVLDVGCGAGAFLDQARLSGLQTFGMELNPIAAENARAKGHRISERLLHDLPASFHPDGFDLITLFQVLEHVPDPIAILNHAAKHLKSGGYIAIAVPSKSGIYRWLTRDPAQWPPHHISRWCLKDFRTLAGKTKLRLREAGGDMLLGAGIEQTIRFRRRMAEVLGKHPHREGDFWPRGLSWIYRKSGMKYIAPRWGSSIYAYFQKV